MSYDRVQVGNRIRGSRLEKGWTQEQLNRVAVVCVFRLANRPGLERSLGLFAFLAQRKRLNSAI